MIVYSMSDEGSILTFDYSSFEGQTSNTLTNKQNYLCKFDNCGKSYTQYSNRIRHYRTAHSGSMPPKRDTPTLFNNNVTVNLMSVDDDRAVVEKPVTQQIKASPHIVEAIKLSQSFFNRENTDTAIALIKGSSIVQENALEMRLVWLYLIIIHSYCSNLASIAFQKRYRDILSSEDQAIQEEPSRHWYCITEDERADDSSWSFWQAQGIRSSPSTRVRSRQIFHRVSLFLSRCPRDVSTALTYVLREGQCRHEAH